MAEIVAGWLVVAGEIYLGAGLLFAGPFLVRGLGKVDRVAGDAGAGFRLIILPGVVAFWPLLARRWLCADRSGGRPPKEGEP